MSSLPERPAVPGTRKQCANGEGAIFWDARRHRRIGEVSTVDPTGKPKRVARSAKTQAEALRLLPELQRQAEQGLLPAARRP